MSANGDQQGHLNLLTSRQQFTEQTAFLTNDAIFIKPMI